MVYEKYVKECVKLLEQHTESLHLTDLTEAWDTIEDAPAFTGKVWVEDVLDVVYNKKVPGGVLPKE